MNRYVATFHTHFAAVCTHRAMTGAGVLSTRRAGSPRALLQLRHLREVRLGRPAVMLMHRAMEQVALERAEGYMSG